MNDQQLLDALERMRDLHKRFGNEPFRISHRCDSCGRTLPRDLAERADFYCWSCGEQRATAQRLPDDPPAVTLPIT